MGDFIDFIEMVVLLVKTIFHATIFFNTSYFFPCATFPPSAFQATKPPSI
jgi:hypothetical protein